MPAMCGLASSNNTGFSPNMGLIQHHCRGKFNPKMLFCGNISPDNKEEKDRGTFGDIEQEPTAHFAPSQKSIHGSVRPSKQKHRFLVTPS